MGKQVTAWQKFLHLLVSFTLLGNIILPMRPPVPERPVDLPLLAEDSLLQLDPVLSVQPSSQTVLAGSYFTVTIQLSDLSSTLSAFQSDLSFDPTRVQPVNIAVNEQYLAASGRAALCPNPIQPAPGIIRMACASSGEVDGPTADGVLGMVTFLAHEVGNSSLTLTNVYLPGAGVPPVLITASLQSGQVSVIPQAGVTVGPEATQTGMPGTAVTHAITVTNNGTYTDTFSLAISGNIWPTTPAMSSVGPLAVGQAVQVPITVSIPSPVSEEVVIGSDTFTVTAVSGWDVNILASAQLTTLAEISPALAIMGDGLVTGTPGSTVTHTVNFINQGNYTDTLSFSLDGQSWSTTPVTGTIGPLGAGQSLTTDFFVTIPPIDEGGMPPAMDVFTITAVSGWDTTITGTAIITTESRITPDVLFSADQTIGTLPGTAVTYTFTLTNQGDFTDTYSLNLAGNSWPTTAPEAAGPIAVGAPATVMVAVIVPTFLGETVLGSDTFTLTAVSSWDSTVTASVQGTTEAIVNPSVTLDGPQSGSGLIGSQVIYTPTLTNMGDYTDTYTLTLSASEWPTTLSIEQLSLPASGSDSFQLTVTIPETAQPDEQDSVTVTAVSHLDPTVQAELQVTTTAVQTGYHIYLPIILRTSASANNLNLPDANTAETPLYGPPLPPAATNTPGRPDDNWPLATLEAMINQGCYQTDMNCDQNVDEADLSLAAAVWNCAAGDSCYATGADLDGSGLVDVVDLAWIGNDYDVLPPEMAITAPQEGQVVGGVSVVVSGLLTDTHSVFTVTVNGTTATVNGNNFLATVPVTTGTQVLNVVATNNLGQVSIASRMVGVDGAGPMITVHRPENRQAVYTFQPAVVISYTDFYTAVNPTTLNVTLTDPNGLVTDITGDLTVGDTGAAGTVSPLLSGDTSYTMTISLADVLGNTTAVQTTFFVPVAADTIVPPVEPEGAGYVSGVIYDSATCDEYLTTCQGLAGVQVTLEKVDTEALAQVRTARANQLEALNYQLPLAPMQMTTVTTSISGTIVTGPDGFFVFPVGETGVYWLRAEKDGFTYGQREAEIVRKHSTPTNAIFLTPLDPAVTPCDDTGCFHTNSDGSMEVDIPPGAIPAGESIDVIATNIHQVEFLPNGELPPGTWETYAFNLSGASEITFTQPITVRIQNTREFSAGTEIPLGFWNQATQQWEHEGTAVVVPGGQWVEMQISHFSFHDPNFPTSPIPVGINPAASSPSSDDEESCPVGQGACFINIQSGEFEETITLPSVNILGEEVAPQLIYNSNRANPTEILDFDLSVASWGGQLSDHIGFELYIEGLRTDSFTFLVNSQTVGEVGRFRYLWDSRNAEGLPLSSGIYEYRARFRIPYRAQYCGPLNGRFGNPPDCTNWPTGIFVDAYEDVWSVGTVEVDTQVQSPFGTGWVLNGLEQIAEDEAGHVLLTDGERNDEFYYTRTDLLSENSESDFNFTQQFPTIPVTNLAMSMPTLSDNLSNEQHVSGSELMLLSVSQILSPTLERSNLSLTPTIKLPAWENTSVSSEASFSPELVPVCGDITISTTWTATHSPYVITCDVDILAGVTLTIEPGVEVLFEDASDDLVVNGTLLAIGTSSLPIMFRPETGTTAGSWGRIEFMSGSDGTLEYTYLIQGGSVEGQLYIASGQVQVLNSTIQESANTGVVIINASPTISANYFYNNAGTSDGGGLRNSGGSPTIDGNYFDSNTVNGSGSAYGGGIYSSGGSPMIAENYFYANMVIGSNSAYGGGIYLSGGNPAINGNSFDSNTVSANSAYGGGIYDTDSSPTISYNSFDFNTVSGVQVARGGGIYTHSGDPIILQNYFFSNVVRASGNVNGGSYGAGGGVYSSGGNPIIRNSFFFDNLVEAINTHISGWTYGTGGGFHSNAGNPIVEDNSFFYNRARAQGSPGSPYPIVASGGGIRISTGAIANNVLNYNSIEAIGREAFGYGGGIYASGTIQNNAITNNNIGVSCNLSCSAEGGGIYYSGTGTIRNNNVYRNQGSNGSGISLSGSPLVFNNLIIQNGGPPGAVGGISVSGNPIVDYNNVWGNIGIDYSGVVPGPHDISEDPIFVDALGGDFHLMTASPAINAGHPSNFPLTDFEGDPRPLGVASDMGIDEYDGLWVGVLDPATDITLGEVFSYHLRIENNSTFTYTDVTLSDALPDDASFLNYEADSITCLHDGNSWGGLLNCFPQDGTLAPRESQELTVTLVSTDTIINPKFIQSIVTATATVNNQNETIVVRAEINLRWCQVQLNDNPIGADLQAAISASAFITDVIKVSGYCYIDDLLLNKTLTLQGGWSRGINTYDPSLYITTLDARHQGSVLRIQNAGNPVVENFSITGANTSGIYIFNSSPIIRENVIFENSARNSGLFNNNGGGIHVASGNPIIELNNITDNSANNGGDFYYNFGGGIYVAGGNPIIRQNTITGNTASNGGGLGIYSGSSIVEQNLFIGNNATEEGGAIYDFFAALVVSFNTFYGNAASYGGAVFGEYDPYGNVQTHSNIIVGNSAWNGGGIYGPNVTSDYNDLWNNSGGDYGGGAFPGLNDIASDPLFTNEVSGDFHLLIDSPAIDTGNPNSFPPYDFEGNARPVGESPDIGIYEFISEIPRSRTATDFSILSFKPDEGIYIRIYPDGREVHFDTQGRHAFTLEPDGRQTIYTYNPDGTIAAMGIVAPGETLPRWVWTFGYFNGKLSAITDPANRVTHFTVDQRGDLVSVITPDGATQQFTYDSRHLMTHYTDQNGAVTTHEYDRYGRIHRVIEPPRPVYDPATGQTTVMQQERTFTPSDTSYDLLNERTEVGTPADPAPAVPTSDELIDRVEYGRGVRYGHTNKWGSWLDETDGEGRTTTYERDERNNLTRVETPDGDCLEYTYDDMGNLLSERRLFVDFCDTTGGEVQEWQYTYEERFNQIKTETDPEGNTTTYFYDYEEEAGEAGHLIRIEYPPVDDGTGTIVTPMVHYTYNQWGLLETETDTRNVVTHYIYTQGTPDEAYGGSNARFLPGVTPVPGLLTEVIADYGGEDLTTNYRDFDGVGNAGLSIMPGNHLTTTMTYDGMNRLLTETDAQGKVMLFVYDGRGNLIRQVQDYTPDGSTGRNVVSNYTYNAHNQIESERTTDGPLVVSTQYTYDINRQLAVQQDGRGSATIYLYDEADQLVNTIDPAGQVMTYTYALDGQLERLIDADGYVTHYAYDGYGRLITETVDEGGLNLRTIYTYDLNDNVTRITHPDQTATCYEYDSHNRRTAEVRDCGSLNLRSEYKYDLNDNLVYETDPRGVVTYYEYDNLNRLRLIRQDDGGLNLETAYVYDEAGNLAQIIDERGVVTGFTYDELNRLEQTCQGVLDLNLCTVYTYDRLNNQETVTDPEGVTTRTVYNVFGLPTQVIEDYGGLNATTRYSYDNALNLAQIVDANGNPTRYAYTPRNEVAQEIYADGEVVGFTYDGRGNLLVRTTQDNETITHIYDGAGRLLSKDFSTEDPGVPDQLFGYDEMGWLVSAAESANGHNSLLTFVYNDVGDVTVTTQALDGMSWPVGYGYDYVSGVYTTTYPSGVQRVQVLDAIGRLDVVQEGDGTPIADYAYFDLDSYFTLTYANGVVNSTEYDALYRTTRVSAIVTDTVIADYRYGYDDAGNRTYMQRWHEPDHPADVYEYDNLYQLIQVWYGADATAPISITNYAKLQWYDLDNLGNRLEVQNDGVSQVYAPNDGLKITNSMNRYEAVDATPFLYDERGNNLADGVNTYTYDILNRQIGMSNAENTAEYVYDAVGRRIAKVVNSQLTIFVFDIRYQVLEEQNEIGNAVTRYTYGSSMDENLAMESNGVTYYYHQDALGSITEITDINSDVVERYGYDVFGTVTIFDSAGINQAVSAIGNHSLFTGRWYDTESVNYYYRTRMFSPRVGRFLQTDPMTYIDSLNTYTYHSPTNSTDPLGLSISTLDDLILYGLKTHLELTFALYLLEKGLTTKSFQITNPFFVSYFKNIVPKGIIDEFYDFYAQKLRDEFYSECEINKEIGYTIPIKQYGSGPNIIVSDTIFARLTFYGAESLEVNMLVTLHKSKGSHPLEMDFDDEWVWGDTLNLEGKPTQILPGVKDPVKDPWNFIDDDTIGTILKLLEGPTGKSWQNPEVTIKFPVKEHRTLP